MAENPYQAPQANLVDRSAPNAQEVVFAGFWVRVLATLIDGVLLLAIMVPIMMVFVDFDTLEAGESAGFGWDILSNVVMGAVYVLFWHYKQATPGKMALRLRIVDADSLQPVSVGRLALRYVGYFPAYMLFAIGVIWTAFDGRKQGWHDKMANTVVVRDL